MTKKHTFFKFCIVEKCGEKFTPVGKDQMKCKKCKEKGLILVRFERMSKSLNEAVSTYNFLENDNKNKLIKILNIVDKEIAILKDELKVKK
jgi:hypothetical protein